MPKGHVQLAQEILPDLILMDIRMPEMNGYETLQNLQENPKTEVILVLAMTASVVKSESDKMLDTGFDGFLSKPVTLKE